MDSTCEKFTFGQTLRCHRPQSRFRLAPLLICMAIGTICQSAVATVYEFTGTITSGEINLSSGPRSPVGEPITGTFTFDYSGDTSTKGPLGSTSKSWSVRSAGTHSVPLTYPAALAVSQLVFSVAVEFESQSFVSYLPASNGYSAVQSDGLNLGALESAGITFSTFNQIAVNLDALNGRSAYTSGGLPNPAGIDLSRSGGSIYLGGGGGSIQFSIHSLKPVQPKPTSPYKVSLFANSPAGTAQPGPMASWRDNVIVGFKNYTALDGSDGKSSTLVEFSEQGKVRRIFTVPGHNDALRVVGDDDLWALQNATSNPSLVVIQLRSGNQRLYHFARPPHGGGYGGIAVKNDHVYLSASNPSVNSQPNTFPAVVRATLSGNMVILQSVFKGNIDATDIAAGTQAQLGLGGYGLTDPTSMAVDQRGNLVLNSRADSQLVFIQNPLKDNQEVGFLTARAPDAGGGNDIAGGGNDIAFAPEGNPSLLLTAGDSIYRIQSTTFGIEPGAAYITSNSSPGVVGVVDLDTGTVTPIATRFGSAHSLLFVSPDDDRDHDR